MTENSLEQQGIGKGEGNPGSGADGEAFEE